MPALRTRCTNASVAEMLGKLPQIMESVNGAAACAETLASGAASETNKNQFDEFWRFREECRGAIENGEDAAVGNACETADDCYCSYSTCETEHGASKVCKTTTEDFVKCEAECYGSKIDAVALRFLKQDWNVSATDDAGYVDAFVARMTDDHCVGDKQWEEGINSPPGVRWVCDRQCQMDNACNSWTLVDAYRCLLYTSPSPRD